MICQILHLGFLKTVWFNLRYLPFREAIRMPVILARNVQVRYCHRGFLTGGGKTGVLRFGFGDRDHNFDRKSSISIEGQIILNGRGIHSFGPGTCLRIGKNGILTLGNNFTCSVNNRIYCSHRITVGEDNQWSFDNVIMDTDSHTIYSESGERINPNREVVFGNHVWLGCRNVVLKGAKVPDGCIVASGGVVTKAHTEENSIISSNGRVIKQKIKWSRKTAF